MSATPEDVYSDLERGTSASSRSASAPAAGGDQYADLERGATLVQGTAAPKDVFGQPFQESAAYDASGHLKPIQFHWQGWRKELSDVADATGITKVISALEAPGQSHAQRLRAAMARQGPLPGQPTPGQTWADMGRGVLAAGADVAGLPATAINALMSPEGGAPSLMAYAGPQALKADIGAAAQPQTGAGRTIEVAGNLVAPEVVPPLVGAAARGIANQYGYAKQALRELPDALRGRAPSPSPIAGAAPGGFGADTASAARAGLITQDMSPELQGAITAAGPNVNPRVANLHAKAERIGVQLTPGEATGDPTMIREEEDDSNSIAGLRNQKLANVSAIRNRIQQLRDQVAPDSPSSSGQDVAHSVMGEYSHVTAADEAAEDTAWQRFRDISGNNLPIDARATAEAIEARLEAAQSGAAPSMMKNAPDAAFTQPQLARLRQVAGAQQRVQEAMAAGNTPDPADVELASVRGQDWMAWRKAANRQMRGQPNEQTFAAGVVKEGLDNPIFTQGAQQNPQIMAAGKDAVAASRYIHQRMEADPAYAATANGTAESTTFLRHANTENGIRAMQESLLGPNYESRRGVEDLGAHHLDEVMRGARLEPDQTGRIATSTLNNLLRNRQSVIRAAVGESAANELDDIRDVARAITPANVGQNFSQSGTLLRGFVRQVAARTPIVREVTGLAGELAESRRLQALTDRTMSPYGGMTYKEMPVPQGSPLSITRRGDALMNQRTPPGRGSPTSSPPPSSGGTPPPPPGTGAPTMPSGGPAAAPEPPPGSTPSHGTGQPVQRLGADIEALRARFRPPLEGNLPPSVQAYEEQAEIARRGMEAARTPEEAAELTRRGVAAQAQAEIANERLQRGRATRGTRAAEQDTGVDFSGSHPPTPSSMVPIPTARAPSVAPRTMAPPATRSEPAPPGILSAPLVHPTPAGRPMTVAEQVAAAKAGTLAAPVADPRVLEALQSGVYTPPTEEELAAIKARKPSSPKPKGQTLADLLKAAENRTKKP